jgi:hypothetical protein
MGAISKPPSPEALVRPALGPLLARGFGWLMPAARESATMKDDLRHKNIRLREKINDVLENHPELRDVVDEVALKQRSRAPVGASILERIQIKLQEQARGIIERRPDLEHSFDD